MPKRLDTSGGQGRKPASKHFRSDGTESRYYHPYSPFQRMVHDAMQRRQLSIRSAAAEIGNVKPTTLWAWLHNESGYPGNRWNDDVLERMCSALELKKSDVQAAIDASRAAYGDPPAPPRSPADEAFDVFLAAVKAMKPVRVYREKIIDLAGRIRASAPAAAPVPQAGNETATAEQADTGRKARRFVSKHHRSDGTASRYYEPHSPFQMMVDEAIQRKQLSMRTAAKEIGNVSATTLWCWLHNESGFPGNRWNDEVLERMCLKLGLKKADVQAAIDVSRAAYGAPQKPPTASEAFDVFIAAMQAMKPPRVYRATVIDLAERIRASAAAPAPVPPFRKKSRAPKSKKRSDET